MTRNPRSFVLVAQTVGLAAIAVASGWTRARASTAKHPAPPSMYIQGCNLGCSSGAGGAQVSCAVVSIAVNQPLRIQFTYPVDPLSVNSNTFQLIDVATGQVPIGTRFVDPSSPDTVVFEPSLSFDSGGNPIFGFTANTTYRLAIPSPSHGDSPPYITSLGPPSIPTRSRMQCDLQTTSTVLSPGVAFCAGDGVDPLVTTPCPCANFGTGGRGCGNSATGVAGAWLFALGSTPPDAVVLYATYLPPGKVAAVLQGDQSIPSGLAFGDGIRCVGGNLLRLALTDTLSGITRYPNAGDPSVTARSAALGDPISPGDVRYYQLWYRDGAAAFCAPPAGADWNVTNGIRITW